jgi:hypothetical protein
MFSSQVVTFKDVSAPARDDGGARHPWWTSPGPTFATGVVGPTDVLFDGAGRLYLPGVTNRVRTTDPANWQAHVGGGYQNTVSGSWGSAASWELRTVPDVLGRSAWELRTDQNVKGLTLADPTTTPTLAAGQFVWLVVDGIDLQGAGGQVRLGIGHDGVPSWRAFEFDLAAGTGDAKGATFAALSDPGPGEWSITDLGNGRHRLAVKWTIAAGESLPAGWWPTLGPGTDMVGNGIVFTRPMVFADEAPPGGLWVPAGTSPNGLVEVAAPGTTGHHTALPFALELTATKPASDGTLAEIVADNGTAAGNVLARLKIVGGSPQLWVSEDGGTTQRTATIAADTWTTTIERRLTLFVKRDEVVLFVDGRSVAGIALADAPTAVASYRVGAEAGGHNGTGAWITTIADAADADVVADVVRMGTAAEIAAMTPRLDGCLYLEV